LFNKLLLDAPLVPVTSSLSPVNLKTPKFQSVSFLSVRMQTLRDNSTSG
jgi:hypothetical protein